MKKILLLLICFLLICGCNKEIKEQKEIKIDNNEIEIKQPEIEEYIDDNIIKIGIYDKNKLLTDYYTSFISNTDLIAVDVIYTNQEYVDNNSTKTNWKKYYNEYQNIEKYKTGFYITFEANGKKIEELILDSTKTFSMEPYLYVYLYDDVNQPDYTFYSHIEPNDENENTIFSSIKLYLCNSIEDITSPITLTVFTYDSPEDFDENNHYRGNSSHTIQIRNTN